MAHLSRLGLELRKLLARQRVAALGTLDDEGLPLVTMQLRPAVSLLVMQSEQPGQPVHALLRVSLRGRAQALSEDSAAWLATRKAYLVRFPERTGLDDSLGAPCLPHLS